MDDVIRGAQLPFHQQTRLSLGNILVTGGLGFIGHNLIDEICLRHDYDRILVLDDKGLPQSNDERSLKGAEKVSVIQKSVLDPTAFDVKFEANYIVHAAGVLGIRNVAEHSLKTLDVNITGTRNCLEYASKLKSVKKFITFSSSEIYGRYATELHENDDATIPTVGRRWCYAASKLSAEQYTMAYGRERNVPYVIIRPFNVYGPYRSGSNAISTFIQRALADKDIVVSGDGSQIRSWCYIDDFLHGVLKAMTAKSCNKEVLNLGNPNCGCSILELANLVIKLTNSRSRVVVTNSRDEDVMVRKPNIHKAIEKLDYAPATSLEEGVRRTIDWIRSSAQEA